PSFVDISPPVAMEGTFITTELRGALAKVAVFLLVQGLVYLILTNSSDVFSKDKKLV
uniref:Uncharacterized protein n=1 Tax=Aegilops tauschii subsp. strangulata TaxID=200361 RepID=A0A453FJW8_AEGTS